MQQQFPKDWDDETKCFNKEMTYLKSPEECVFNFPVCLNGGNNQRDDKTSYYGMICEYWKYDTSTGKHWFAIRKCPICGSYHITEKSYNNLCPNVLAGSMGIIYMCEDCGYYYSEDQIMS